MSGKIGVFGLGYQDLSQALQGEFAWKVAGLPTTFLVDKQGRIVASAIGGREFDHPGMIEAIRGLLRKK